MKAQIHAGGRGKGGGVALVADAGEAARVAGQMLGMTLVTAQTGPEGRLVSRLLVEETLDIAKELYLGVLIDRTVQRPLIMASAAGGMDIEKVAAETPELIFRAHVAPGLGCPPFKHGDWLMPSVWVEDPCGKRLHSCRLCTEPSWVSMLHSSRSIRL